MTVKMLTEKRGALQGVTVTTILRQAYSTDSELRTDGEWEGYAGAIVRPRTDIGEQAFDVQDYVLELHEE